MRFFHGDYSVSNLRRVAACYPVGSESARLLGVVAAAMEQGLISAKFARELVCIHKDTAGFQVDAVMALQRQLAEAKH